MKKLLIAIILFSNPAMAININGQAQKVGVSVDNSTHKNEAVSRAYAPATRPTADCLGGSSMGVSASDFGFTLGGTSKSKPCNAREDAKLQIQMGNEYLAYLIHACIDKEKRELTRYTDKPCPNLKVKKRKEACDYPTEQCKKSRH